MKWYVAKTKPKKEEYAVIHLSNQGFPVYLPKSSTRRFFKNKIIQTIKPLFPCYLFVQIGSKLGFHYVQNTRGVSSIVKFGDYIPPIDDSFIQMIKDHEKDGLINLEPRKYKKGESVEIIKGPLEGFEAVFDQELKDNDRVRILLKTIEYQASVVIHPLHIASVTS